MSQSCLCCSSFIPRFTIRTWMSFLGLISKNQAFHFVAIQPTTISLPRIPPPPMTTPLSPFPYSPPPLLILNLAVPLLALKELLLFRFFFSCAQPQNLLRLGEGISRLSRAAHQCVLCSLLYFRASGHQIPNMTSGLVPKSRANS